MEELAGRDLDRAHESLYFAARRYRAVTERGFLQSASSISPEHDPEFVSVGAAAELADAGERYREAYARWAAFLTPADDEGAMR